MRFSYSDLDERRANNRNGSKADVRSDAEFSVLQVAVHASTEGSGFVGTRLILLLNSDRRFEGDGGLLG
jgi:hypothetical protein